MKNPSIAFLSFLCAASTAVLSAAAVPRPEYPRPQFERATWINLNGRWSYAFDFGQSGLHAGRELQKSKGFDKKITVPFCPESSLSGVGYKDFIPAMWYHRKLAVPADWKGKRIFLNFGGVDYESEIFIDGVTAGLHYGGSASFSVDLTLYVTPGATHDLVVRVKDANGAGQPGGKQCGVFKSEGCSYTRTTGIWQTVWLEAVDPAGLKGCRIVPDLDGRAFVFTPEFLSTRADRLRITVKASDGTHAGAAEVRAVDGVAVVVPLKVLNPWSPEDPHLYDIVYETLDADGRVTDSVRAYAGLRKVSLVDGRLYLNNRPRYLRLVLDQGFYPDGIWTAPSDAALKRDIELSMAAGFNGARLHQKVFEERFHYWADRLGYLTWGEMSSWGSDPQNVTAARNFIPEWCEVVRRDLNHPSIIAWTPYNETWNRTDFNQHQRTQNDVYELTRAIDPTRPVNGASGDYHAKTDLWTVHCYHRAPDLAAIDLPEGKVFSPDWLTNGWDVSSLPYHRYGGQPYLIDEFGGLGWIPPERRAADNTWGYGNAIKTEEEFFGILKGEVEVILGAKRICGYCYTQLTDVEQEQNGVYYYDRTPKFDVKRFRDIFGRDPALPDGAAAPKASEAFKSAEELGRRYWRTKAEEDRAAWMDALDREGHDFRKRYSAKVSPRGVYKLNREARLAYFIVNSEIAKKLGSDSQVFDTRDGCIRFDWKLLEDGRVDYRYSAPTNWEVYVQAAGEKPKCNPIKEANCHFGTAMPTIGQVALEMAHHREAWKAGLYADVPFPTNEIAAADNFIFACRDAFLRLGFGEKGSVDGQIYLCTFDSNYPGGHTDFPAHFHICMSCRDGQQTHHYYMDPATGRVTSDCYQDMSSVVDVWDRVITFNPGDTFPYFDGRGRVAFRVKILEDGTGLEISRPDGSRRVRVASPVPKDYVEVLEPDGDGWKAVKRVKVEDLPDDGIMRTPEGEVRYNPANGSKLK